MSGHLSSAATSGAGLVPLSPMLAVSGLPHGPDTEAEYAYETLWNGARVLAYLPNDGSVRLWSATGMDVTAQYPELQALPVILPARKQSSTGRSSPRVTTAAPR